MEKELNWAVIGTGVIANEMAQALQRMDKTLYGVANRTQAKAIEKDSIRHWGFTVSVMKSKVIALDKNQRKYLKEGGNGSVALELNHINLPSDHDSYAKDFDYPSLSIGLRYTMNNRVRFHRTPDLAWDKIEEVPYHSRCTVLSNVPYIATNTGKRPIR